MQCLCVVARFHVAVTFTVMPGGIAVNGHSEDETWTKSASAVWFT